MDYTYPDGEAGTVEGDPLRTFGGSFIHVNSDFGDWGAVADADAKTITMDFIIDGGAYAIDPASIVWSAHVLYWQDVSSGNYSSERYKDPDDGSHGQISAQPAVEQYQGSDGLTHVSVTYQLDSINTDWAYDYRGQVYCTLEIDGVSGVWEAFPSELYISFLSF